MLTFISEARKNLCVTSLELRIFLELGLSFALVCTGLSMASFQSSNFVFNSVYVSGTIFP